MADHADRTLSGEYTGNQITVDEMLAIVDPIPGWMSHGELTWLFQAAAHRRMIVEIGTWFGRSAKAMALGTPGVIFCVDHWLGAQSEMGAYAAELQRHGPDGIQSQCVKFLQPQVDQKKIILLNLNIRERFTSGILYSLFETTQPDMIFIDGEHTTEAVCADIKLARGIAAPRALICGHDYNRPEVQVAVKSQFDESITPIRQGPDRIWSVELP